MIKDIILLFFATLTFLMAFSGNVTVSHAEDDFDDAPVVEIPDDKRQLIGVRTVEVAVKPFQRTIRTVGRIEYDERRQSTVNTKIEGWVERLYVDYTGRYVKKGEAMADIYSPELVATQREFLNLLRWANGTSIYSEQELVNSYAEMLKKDARLILDAARQRLKLWDITDAQIDEIERTGKVIRTLTIYCPVSGYVTEKKAVAGMRVMAGEKLFDVVDLSSVWVMADVYENELPLIKVGQVASIGLSYSTEKAFTSKVDYIYPVLSGERRTAKVRFTVANPKGELRPQMFTNVEIGIDLGQRLVIPDEAVIDTGVEQRVYVDKGEGNFEPRLVQLGLRSGGMVEVTKGLKAKERVASSAAFLIDSEAQLKGIAPKK
ncbi:MAG: efflux RND transporter periplasmic adaptor subunit [Nitrospirae bacterium]|uniref:efflux RND transporter periplasmic adaptor subunit n=1 Tax=Candidatus Magnetobacterium casense TaxID=1455061 RepID=UPI00069905F7|nr:efflux RND transporter periplasmic adaptor subunit [Candidatus Magnetobacterium casensis]MBF0339298.1 efflux RND transporter periplasmic adaptor subunit [Nitrospirota bacterium]